MCDTGSTFWQYLAPVKSSTGAAVAFRVETYAYIYSLNPSCSSPSSIAFSPLLCSFLLYPFTIIALALPSFLALILICRQCQVHQPPLVHHSFPFLFFRSLWVESLLCIVPKLTLPSVHIPVAAYWPLQPLVPCVLQHSYHSVEQRLCSQLPIVPSPALHFIVKLMLQSCLHFECCSRIIIEGCDVH